MCEELLNVPESPHTYHSQEFTTIRPTMLHSTKKHYLRKGGVKMRIMGQTGLKLCLVGMIKKYEERKYKKNVFFFLKRRKEK